MPASPLVAGRPVFAYDEDTVESKTAAAALTALGLTANGASLVTAANYAAMRTLLGLVIGTNVQAYHANLAAIAALTTQAFGLSLLEANDAEDVIALLGLVIGVDVQAWSAQLDDVAALDLDAYGLGLLEMTSESQARTYLGVDTAIAAAVTGLLDFKGATDCSANPNYPAASKGDAYVVSVAGKIGGGSGVSVDVGDVYVASADNAGGTQGSVGSSWFVLEHNLAGAVLTADIGATVAPARPGVNAQTGTTYTIDISDNGGIVTCSNASAITVTVPAGLGAGFHCQVIQKGAGQITFTASATVINNRQSHTKSAGQHAICVLEADVSGNFYLGGDTAA